MNRYIDVQTPSFYKDDMIPIVQVKEVLGMKQFYEYIDCNPQIKERLLTDTTFKLSVADVENYFK